MKQYLNSINDLDPDKLYLIPLGGQSEIGAIIYLLVYQGKILIIDCGAAYPKVNLPGVDLLYPNTTFLENNQESILALVLSNCKETHNGSIFYLLHHVNVPSILAPKFIVNLLHQYQSDIKANTINDYATSVTMRTKTVEFNSSIGPFNIEWVPLFYADEFMLKIECDKGLVLYTSTFKIGQNSDKSQNISFKSFTSLKKNNKPICLLSASAGIENYGYSQDELDLEESYNQILINNNNRIIFITNQLNIARIRLIQNLTNRFKLNLYTTSEFLTNYLNTYNELYPPLDFQLINSDSETSKNRQLILITGNLGNALTGLNEYLNHKNIVPQSGDILIYNSEITLGQKRTIAKISDKLLAMGITLYKEPEFNVYVNDNASQEDLKLVLSIINPDIFIPTIGEYRHIYQHAHLANNNSTIKTKILNNGDIFCLNNSENNVSLNQIENSLVYFSSKQGEKISTASVKERRSLCYEGVISLSIVLKNHLLVPPINIEEHASGIRFSTKWAMVLNQIEEIIVSRLGEFKTENSFDLESGTEILRQDIIKLIKKEFYIKPFLQILITQIEN